MLGTLPAWILGGLGYRKPDHFTKGSSSYTNQPPAAWSKDYPRNDWAIDWAIDSPIGSNDFPLLHTQET